jgi:uncharacterized membrane protein (DUF373 family)
VSLPQSAKGWSKRIGQPIKEFPVSAMFNRLKTVTRVKLNMNYTHRFEAVVLHTMAVLLMIVLAFATYWLVFTFLGRIMSADSATHTITDTDALHNAFQKAMAGIFVVLIGIELLETIRTYNTHRRFRLEIVLVVGAIAVARHVIQLDFHHVDGQFMAGLGVLIFALVAGFWLLQRMPQNHPGDLADPDSCRTKETDPNEKPIGD